MRVMKSEGGINWSLSSPIEWVGPGGWARNYERFSMSNMYEHYLVGMWQRLRSDGLPSLWEAGSWVWAFLKSMIVELHAFATADTCDGTFAALFLGAFCAYLLLSRKRELENSEVRRKGPPVKVSAALAGHDFWERYDAARGWQSNIAGAKKTSHLSGGRNHGRPLDALLPRREYVPKRRAWEGSGTASKEGIVAPLMREKVEGGLEQSPAACSEHAANGEQADGDTPVTETVDWEHTRQLAVEANKAWGEEVPYTQWLDIYNRNFKTAGSLAASGTLLEPLGPRLGLLEINRQFFRDATAGDMVRLDNQELPSSQTLQEAVEEMHRQNRRARKPVMDLGQRYDHHVARYAWEGLVRRTGGDEALAHEVASFANQNLGIICYEHLVEHYASDVHADGSCGMLAVLQTGHHYVDIANEDHGQQGTVLVRFVGLFKLVPVALLAEMVDELDSSLVRAVAASAMVRIPLGDDGRAAGVVRFAIHRPVQLHVAAEDVVSARNQGAAVARSVQHGEQVRLWLAAVLTNPRARGQVSAPPEGLQQGTRVRIHGMAEVSPGLAHFDGRTGTLIRHDEDRDRWSVDLDLYGGLISFSRQNLVIEDSDKRPPQQGPPAAPTAPASPASSPGQDRTQDSSDSFKGLEVWTEGKERLVVRLMSEGFSCQASLRAILAVESFSPLPNARSGSMKADEESGREPRGATGVVACKSTTILMECIVWLCQHLGDETINRDLTASELAKVSVPLRCGVASLPCVCACVSVPVCGGEPVQGQIGAG